MNSGMCLVEQRMYQDNVCVPGTKILVSLAKAEYYSVYQVRIIENQNKSGMRCFFGDKELFC